MVFNSLDAGEQLRATEPDLLRDRLKLLAQELMDVEVTQLGGAGLHELSENRLTYGNGCREWEWDTRVGIIELDIPKLRAGSYFPSLLESRRRHERALLSVVQEAYVHGMSTRSSMLWPRSARGISRSRVYFCGWPARMMRYSTQRRATWA